jgi:hypothetical protein
LNIHPQTALTDAPWRSKGTPWWIREAHSLREHVCYGGRLERGQWVGVGSVCKRNGDPKAVAAVLLAIKRERPDLTLHGFGLKTTALASPLVRSLLHTADSMAWSFAARREGRNPNSWEEAKEWAKRIERAPMQMMLPGVVL